MKPKEAKSAEPYDKTKRDAAAFLGVTVWTIDRYIKKRKVPYVKINNYSVRFRLSDLVQFAERQRVA
jgi:predicted site-specific integrase-resolvase